MAAKKITQWCFFGIYAKGIVKVKSEGVGTDWVLDL